MFMLMCRCGCMSPFLLSAIHMPLLVKSMKKAYHACLINRQNVMFDSCSTSRIKSIYLQLWLFNSIIINIHLTRVPKFNNVMSIGWRSRNPYTSLEKHNFYTENYYIPQATTFSYITIFILLVIYICFEMIFQNHGKTKK